MTPRKIFTNDRTLKRNRAMAIPDDAIYSTWCRVGSLAKTARELNTSTNTIFNRLRKMGENTSSVPQAPQAIPRPTIAGGRIVLGKCQSARQE